VEKHKAGSINRMGVKGVIFDIKELAVFDGPGIRTTVFFKGCPLRCRWCHNPEGLSFKPQLMVSLSSCTRCGKCTAVCPNPAPGSCTLCGGCLRVCPLGLRRIAGEEYTPRALAEKLLRNADYLRNAGGGFTVSGGEPTGQPEFLLELLGLLRGSHRAIETCGYCSREVFSGMLGEIDLVMMDLKIIDSDLHRRYTGMDNAPILENLEILKGSGKPFIVRIPLIPGVNDTEANLRAAAERLAGSANLLKTELLPYHKTAGAKYSMIGMEYRPDFNIEQDPNGDTRYFLDRDIPCVVL
jgi:pyruvate formate lyase activating enzyme